MNELIKISEQKGQKVVSARELYQKLGYNKAVWKRWYEKNIINNSFAIENEDYSTLNIMLNGNATKDFALTIDFAKRISMLARTIEGEKVRNYFIEVEKQAKKLIKPMSTLDMVQASIDAIRANQQDLQEVKKDIIELKAKNITKPEYFTIAGFGSLKGISVNIKLASKLGRAASKICRQRNLMTDEIPDPRFGKVKMYPKNVLKEVFSTVQLVN